MRCSRCGYSPTDEDEFDEALREDGGISINDRPVRESLEPQSERPTRGQIGVQGP